MDDLIDDLFILRLIRAGDRLAFKHLFELYFAPLCRFVHLYIKKPEAAEDIVLDIFTGFWEKRETLQIQVTIKAYLFQSARNRALNYLRDNEHFVPTNDFSSLERFENTRITTFDSRGYFISSPKVPRHFQQEPHGELIQ